MKQLLILSGKGGTGKTTVAAAFIRLSNARAFADCDVDAPNLHLAVAPSDKPEREEYLGLPKAMIDPLLCVGCGACSRNCRFDAIIFHDRFCVDPVACEGCGVCMLVCPTDAVTLAPAVAGDMMLFISGDTVFSTARLKTGSGTTGKLVTKVKERMRERSNAGFAVIDGSPGIGCPVIASLSGVDMVLVVAEPSVSGLSDMDRVLKTASGFHVRPAVCVNKYDTSPCHTEAIESFCCDRGIPFAGRIPYDPEAVKAINDGLTVVDRDCPAGCAVRDLYKNVMSILYEGAVQC